MKNKIYHVISEVFGIPIEEVSEYTSADEVSNWDSLAHINLILVLEDEFNISFSPDDISEMLTVESILNTLVKYGLS